MLWVFREKVKLRNIMTLYRVTLCYVKTTLLPYTFLLSKSQLVMKYSIKLVIVSTFFGDGDGKYYHDDFQTIFHIIKLISSCP